MVDPYRALPASLRSQPLAIDGGPAVLPGGPPAWPVQDERIRDQLLAAWADGSWGRYESLFSNQVIGRLRALQGAEHVLLCCSGTMGVELALRGLGVKPGDEVVLAGYDFPGNFRAVEAVGAMPVLVDINPQSWCMAPTRLPEAFSTLTRAIIVSHLHGGLADMRQVVELARDAGVGVVEDACQAPGAMVQDRRAGMWGDVGVLSFGGSKLLTAGRGGALVTNDMAVWQRAKIYGERGNVAFPLSELQAAVLLPQLELLDQQNQRRGQSVQILLDSWQDLRIVRPVLPSQQPGTPSYYKLALRYDAQAAGGRPRARFIDALVAEGVANGPGFRGFVRRGAKRCRSVGNLTNAADAAANTVLLHHPALLLEESYVAQMRQSLRKVACHFLGDQWNSGQ